MSGLVVVDTSVWIAQFAGRGPDLTDRLDDERVRVHEFIVGELILGAIPRGHSALATLNRAPRVPTLLHEEVYAFVRFHRLEGSGIGWVDVHVLASAQVAGAELWAADAALLRAAARAGVHTWR